MAEMYCTHSPFTIPEVLPPPPTCNEVGLGLFVGPGRVHGLALQAGANSAVPVPDEVGIVSPALGVRRCHYRVGIERQEAQAR
jgi:hypothetical protein